MNGIAVRYSLLTLAMVGAMYWSSSVPDVSTTGQDPAVLLVFNVSHAPLFAGLAYCWLKAVSNGDLPSRADYWVTFLGAGTCAVFDEWHQSFVPGRHASVSDLLLDFAGIGGVLLFVHLRTATARSVPEAVDARCVK